MVLVEVYSCLFVRNRDFSKFSITTMKTISCLGIESGGSATQPKHVYLSFIIATSSLESGKKKWALRFSFNFTDLIVIIPVFLGEDGWTPKWTEVKDIANCSPWRINMLFANKYDNHYSHLFGLSGLFSYFITEVSYLEWGKGKRPGDKESSLQGL